MVRSFLGSSLRRRWIRGLLVALAAMGAGPPEPRAPAAEAPPQNAGAVLAGDATFQARLEAGEFVPLIEAARKAATLQDHDAQLGRIALAQNRLGLRGAAIRTAGEIYQDRHRADILARISAEPIGARFGAPGGGAQADFDSLIELITSTVAPQSWDEVGGPGSIAPFETGVAIDAAGVLRLAPAAEPTGQLAALRRSSRSPDALLAARQGDAPSDVRRFSALRKVSLTRLEREVQLRLAAGRQPTDAMQVLAGLRRIEYLFVYPESGDVVVAGPAGDWRVDAEGRFVAADDGAPLVRLDDLVVVLRHVLGDPEGRFGCLIVPRAEGLARLKAYAEQSARRPLRPGERPQWLAGLRAALGRQDIEVYGLDPRTRAARVMVEADYHMKLVGMGIVSGTPEVPSYLDSIEVKPGDPPPPMSVLRWWFTLDDDPIEVSADRLAFALRGRRLKVLSENEMLTAQGERIHTGRSDDVNRRFAERFTAHFDALARKYPIYAELRHLGDIALVAALIRGESLAHRAEWHLTCFGPEGDYPVPLGAAPREVDSVVGHRVVYGTMVVAGVSGGVRVDPLPLVSAGAMVGRPNEALGASRAAALPETLPRALWWWD